jgi:hypothetical protein
MPSYSRVCVCARACVWVSASLRVCFSMRARVCVCVGGGVLCVGVPESVYGCMRACMRVARSYRCAKCHSMSYLVIIREGLQYATILVLWTFGVIVRHRTVHLYVHFNSTYALNLAVTMLIGTTFDYYLLPVLALGQYQSED